MEEKNIQRPFILEIDESKIEVIQSINNIMQTHKLPCYIMDMILSEVGTQVKEGAKNEIARAKAQVVNQEAVSAVS